MFNGRTLKEFGQLPPMDMQSVEIVLVTGAGPNLCGHILLMVKGGHYFHFDGPSMLNYPRYLTDAEFRNYLTQSKKKELLRKALHLPCPERARDHLLHLMQNRWPTMLISHNCASFAAEIIFSGGNFWSVPQHCPTVDMHISTFFDRLFPKPNLRQPYGFGKCD